VVVQTGAQQTNGWEFGVTGSPTTRWQIAGGYANQTARITSRTAAAREGASVALVPRSTVSLWNKVQITTPVSAGVGIVHQDRMFAAIDNTVTLPAFTRVDAGLFLNVTRALRAQLNVENLFDRRYFSTAHSNSNIMPGAPRTYRLTLNATY
jgi:catecholate siderophore receptor